MPEMERVAVMKSTIHCAAAICLLAMPVTATAATLTADTLIEYEESPAAGDIFGVDLATANGGGGGVADGGIVPLSYLTDGDATTYVSLPSSTSATLEFSGGYLVNGEGDDLFVDALGVAGETAVVHVSEDGNRFVQIGTALGGQRNSFDFISTAVLNAFGSDMRIRQVRVVGNTSGPFDLARVTGRGAEAQEAQEAPVVPLPAGAPLLLGGLAGLALIRSTRRAR